jgi:hypothetical protein
MARRLAIRPRQDEIYESVSKARHSDQKNSTFLGALVSNSSGLGDAMRSELCGVTEE